MKMQLKDDALYIASLAPSFPVFFNCHPLQLVTALKSIGFTHVEETAVVLPRVLDLRKKALAVASKPLIGESCPKVRQLIVEEYPDLQQRIAAVPSPMELHGRILKRTYGSSARTVFVSPCKYKITENSQKKSMDDVWLFDELKLLFDAKLSQPLNQLEKTGFDSVLPLKHLRLGVLSMTVHGPHEVRRYFSQLSANACAPSYIEALYCKGGCAGEYCRFWNDSNDLIENKSNSSARRLINVWEGY